MGGRTLTSKETSARLTDAIRLSYLRERSRYSELLDLVLADVSAVRRTAETIEAFTVTSRVKDPGSLQTKIRVRAAKLESSNCDQSSPLNAAINDALKEIGADDSDANVQLQARRLLDAVPDLAGVRLMSYDADSRASLLDHFRSVWSPGDNASPFTLDEEPIEHRPRPDHHEFYDAIHLRLRYDPKNPRGEDSLRKATLAGATCEVQFSTLLGHVMNEISHSLNYKPVATETGVITERLSDLYSRITNAQRDVDLLQETIRSATASGKETYEDEGGFGSEGVTEGAQTPREDSKGGKPRRTNARLVIVGNELLDDGAEFRFDAQPGNREAVQRWADETGRPIEALTARWASDSGRLVWDYAPGEPQSATALTQLLLSRALEDPVWLSTPIQGAKHWKAVAGPYAGKTLEEIARDFEIEKQVRSAFIETAGNNGTVQMAADRARRLGASVRDVRVIAQSLKDANLLDFDGEPDLGTVLRIK